MWIFTGTELAVILVLPTAVIVALLKGITHTHSTPLGLSFWVLSLVACGALVWSLGRARRRGKLWRQREHDAQVGGVAQG